MRDFIPLEAAAEFRIRQIVKESGSMQAFIETLDSEQTRRFYELSQEILHTGMEDGIKRAELPDIVKYAEILTLGAQTFVEVEEIHGDNLW